MQVNDAIELCEDILDKCYEIGETNFKAKSFTDGVADTTEGILENIKIHSNITEGQQSALKNMYKGLLKWER